MTDFVDEHLSILVGDCRSRLGDIPDSSIDAIITSPPYWGLRDYGNESQIGLEETPEEYVAQMVEIFRIARRVLRDDGTLWINLGDSYSGAGKNSNANFNERYGKSPGKRKQEQSKIQINKSKRCGLSPKNLVGIPWRVAFALQEDGWILRSEIIWAKPNPMPESVEDRPTRAHEQIFLFAKSPVYFYDAESIQERAITAGDNRGSRTDNRRGLGYNARAQGTNITNEFRNKRTVWTIPTQPYNGAHFAAFPEDLVEPCILAGSRIGGVVLDPFGGSGTTGLVANRLGRKAILIELNEDYVDQIKKRTAQAPLGI